MGLFSKVFSKMHSPKTNSDAKFEEQVKKDGVEHASSRIAELVNEKITSKALALQFVLEELDAARDGNEKAEDFVLNSGFNPYEYIGALEKTTWEGDESELEHAQLYLRHFLTKISDIDLMVELSVSVVDKIMQKWELGKYASSQSSLKGGMRIEDAGVDILSIARNNNVIYINDEADHLFKPDKEGDEKLDGRGVVFVFSGQSDSSVIEIFVAFNDSDSYTMFTLQTGMIERLNYVAQAIYNHLSEIGIQNVLSPNERYSTQYFYTFKAYRKNNKYFMVNNKQTQAYLIDEVGIKRDDVDEIREIFWSDPIMERMSSAKNQPKPNLDQRKEEVAQHVKDMCEGPMGQINLEFPADGKEKQLVESSIGHLDYELLLSTDPYLLAMAVLINTANSGLQHKEYNAVCMLSAAVLNAARQYEGTKEREIEGINGFAETALDLLKTNRPKADLNLGAELVINMAVNQWNAKGEKVKYEEYLKENGKLPDSKNNFEDIIEELYKLSENEGECDLLMRISSTKDRWSNYEFEYRHKDEDWVDELSYRLYCLRPDLVIQTLKNFKK